MLTFHHFDLMYSDGSSCGGGCCDYITVTHGGTTQQLCNHQHGSPGPIPDPITTSANTMTVKLVTRDWRGRGQTGFLASVGPGVNVTTNVIGEFSIYCNMSITYNIILSGSWSACLYTSGPEGFHKSEDCRSQKFYVCQNNADFSSPPQGEDIISKYFYV